MQSSVLESPVELSGSWIWVPYREEIPTTFQVGMVGADGVILASDRRIITDLPSRMPLRHRIERPRFSITEGTMHAAPVETSPPWTRQRLR
jgi:hypothetical protein